MSSRCSRLAALVPLGLAALAACKGPEIDSFVASAGGPAPLVHVVSFEPGMDRPVSTARNPMPTDSATLASGRRLFNKYNCSGCHGDHAGGGMAPSLRDSTWLYGSEDPQLFASIFEGRSRGMPAWGTTLARDTIWTLVTYIKSLNTPPEPEAPWKEPQTPLPLGPATEFKPATRSEVTK
jgi:cytochrome c oxidase cbb3-type subunit III